MSRAIDESKSLLRVTFAFDDFDIGSVTLSVHALKMLHLAIASGSMVKPVGDEAVVE